MSLQYLNLTWRRYSHQPQVCGWGVSHSLHQFSNTNRETTLDEISYMKFLNILKYSNSYYSTTSITVVHHHNHHDDSDASIGVFKFIGDVIIEKTFNRRKIRFYFILENIVTGHVTLVVGFSGLFYRS